MNRRDHDEIHDLDITIYGLPLCVRGGDPYAIKIIKRLLVDRFRLDCPYPTQEEARCTHTDKNGNRYALPSSD